MCSLFVPPPVVIFDFFKSTNYFRRVLAKLRPVVTIGIAYLLGSIPFGYLIVRATAGGDIRETGSGATGATNVSRRAGKLAGVLTLILDAVKGAAAVMIGVWVLGGPALAIYRTEALDSTAAWWLAAIALAAIAGHIFPVWLRFRGGKGVATGFGVFVVLVPAIVAVAGLIFVGVVVLTRYVSLASMVAIVSIPVLVLLEHKLVSPHSNFGPLISVALSGALLIVFAHRTNVRRLMHGSESKFH
jgi:acyl phosphate:glycerol-3-phosphate acyltransferase